MGFTFTILYVNIKPIISYRTVDIKQYAFCTLYMDMLLSDGMLHISLRFLFWYICILLTPSVLIKYVRLEAKQTADSFLYSFLSAFAEK